MNYIGSKHKLSEFIKKSVYAVLGANLTDKIFCDLFAGTGIVGRNFKKKVKQIISNDIEYYSFVLNKNYIENHQAFQYQDFIEELNRLEGIEGFIFQQYSQNGKFGRLYFSEHNGKKIDAIRQKIEYWKSTQRIN
ncbi:MAG: DNA adenine methylase, partial [Raineya sp.]